MGRCSEGSELAGASRSVLGYLIHSLAGLRTDPDRSQPKEKEAKVKTALQCLTSCLSFRRICLVCRRQRRSARCERQGSGHEVGTISAEVMALSQVLFMLNSTRRHVRSMKVGSNYSLVQMISRQSTPRRFSTPSIPFSLQEIVKLSRLSLALSSFACVVSPRRLPSPNSAI